MEDAIRIPKRGKNTYNENFDGITKAAIHLEWEDGEEKDFELDELQFAIMIRVLGIMSAGKARDGSRNFACHDPETCSKIINGTYDPITNEDRTP